MNFSLLSPLSVICLCVAFSSMAMATSKIYHWVDKDGKSHYSDTAELGTQEIQIINKNIITSYKVQPEDTAEVKEEPAITYQADIISPENDSPLRSNDGSINIQVKTTPEKKATQKLQLFLDGKALGSPQISSTIRVANIDRGTHQLQVQLLDESGKVLARTQIVTVYLQRISSISAP